MFRWVPPAAAAIGLLLAGCGGSDDGRLALTTPPEQPGVEPLPEVKRQQEEAAAAARIRPTKADAKRTRPVLVGWARALRENDHERAAAFFSLPAIVAQGTATRLETAADVRAFNLSLPCGARLISVSPQGRYVVGTFRLTLRPEHSCSTPGERVRVAFVLRGHKIAEWREVPTTPGAPPGPDAPEDAPPAPPKQIA